MAIEQLLKEVGYISNRYEEMAKLTGENFNIFKTLKLTSDEVRLHSSILAELLNVKGTHGQGDLFLKIFIKQLELTDFETESTKSFCEKHIGKVNETSGGRIDILVESSRNSIIIENKIYAGDQQNQLLRYHNFIDQERKKGKKAHLFYLNLFGDEPTKESANGLKANEDYKIISYHSDIIEWLEQCMKEAVSLPIIRETIQQYINLLKILTNQTTNNKMAEEIINLLIDDSKKFIAAQKIAENLDNAKQKIWYQFGKKVCERMKAELPNAVIILDPKFGTKYKSIKINTENMEPRCLSFTLSSNYSSPYIAISPGYDNKKTNQKNELLINKLKINLIDFQGRSNIKVEGSFNQAEWLCRYNILENKFNEMLDNDEPLIDSLVEDLTKIFNKLQESLNSTPET